MIDVTYRMIDGVDRGEKRRLSLSSLVSPEVYGSCHVFAAETIPQPSKESVDSEAGGVGHLALVLEAVDVLATDTWDARRGFLRVSRRAAWVARSAPRRPPCA